MAVPPSGEVVLRANRTLQAPWRLPWTWGSVQGSGRPGHLSCALAESTARVASVPGVPQVWPEGRLAVTVVLVFTHGIELPEGRAGGLSFGPSNVSSAGPFPSGRRLPGGECGAGSTPPSGMSVYCGAPSCRHGGEDVGAQPPFMTHGEEFQKGETVRGQAAVNGMFRRQLGPRGRWRDPRGKASNCDSASMSSHRKSE